MAKRVSGKVKVGIIGSGGIAGAHSKGYVEFADKVEVAALADVNEENMNRLSKQLGYEPRRYTSWKAMLRKEADTIDAVDICLPHHLHKPAIIDAAKAGKHILCEKPLCLTLREADAIGEALKKAKVTYMSAHNQLFLPCVIEAKRIIESGGIGRVLFGRSQDCFRLDRSREQFGWRGDLKTQGGGELIDTGYHPTYRLVHLIGSDPVAVRATFGRYRCPVDGEDTASVSIRFKSGAIGEVFTSWAFPLPTGTHQIHIVGDRGEVYGSGNRLFWKPQGYAEPACKTLPQVNTFVAEIGHFADCLRSGTAPIHGFDAGRMVLDIIVKAAQSAKGWEETAMR